MLQLPKLYVVCIEVLPITSEMMSILNNISNYYYI